MKYFRKTAHFLSFPGPYQVRRSSSGSGAAGILQENLKYYESIIYKKGV